MSPLYFLSISIFVMTPFNRRPVAKRVILKIRPAFFLSTRLKCMPVDYVERYWKPLAVTLSLKSIAI